MESHTLMKYYTRDSMLPFEEDMTTEFKGHRNLVRNEVPSWAQQNNSEKGSRRHISRNLNAFLNSGGGGIIYLGVTDDGKVHGFSMTCQQRDHFRQNLENLMKNYKPPVLPHQYSVHFTPVLNSKHQPDEIRSILRYISSEKLVESDKEKQHTFNSSSYCWCDKEAASVYNLGKVIYSFVIEVTVKAWDPYDMRNISIGGCKKLRIQPYYADEEGKVFFRIHASCVEYSLHSIMQTTKLEVKDLYEAELSRLQKEIHLREEKLKVLQSNS